MASREVHGQGPTPARIMIVGEAPGADEEILGKPFVGASGRELDKMLGEVGISRSECFVTNVSRIRPPGNDISAFFAQSKKEASNGTFHALRDKHVKPCIISGVDHLKREIALVNPQVIIALGGTALWALTGNWGITKWRGSMLYTSGLQLAAERKVIPTLHPAAILRQWSDRALVVNDLRRAARFRTGQPYPKPEWHFTVGPSYEKCYEILDDLRCRADSGRLRISFDLETRGGHIACAGIAWSRVDALCIPFMCLERAEGYWGELEEYNIVYRLYQILRHPNAEVVGQNLLFDAQYTYRHWHFVPLVSQDTMISQHSLFSDLPKSLAFLGSMYCDYYVYWKDEGKNWEPKMGEEQLWGYNCQDCVYTYEIAEALEATAGKMSLLPVHRAQQRLFWPVLEAMKRGVLVDTRRRGELMGEVQEAIARREEFLWKVLGHPLNPGSSKQMQDLFYKDLGQQVILKRGTGRPTLDDEALQLIAKREPILKPIVNCIADIRTLGIFMSTFLGAPLDLDGRMRCSYNIGGSASGRSAPKTYRLSSSQNVFGGGCNLQTIPSEKSKSIGKSKARGAIAGLDSSYEFPDLRSMFIPDPGYTFFNGDLGRADLQVVIAEAEDKDLRAALDMGVDLHLMNAYILRGRDPPPLDELVETHPRYAEYRLKMKYEREFAKVWVHGTNYGGQPRTMAAHTGRTVAECEKAQLLWFGAHPGIKKWHERVRENIKRYRFVENMFGYRWIIFDRVDSVLGEALAWVPQSTVSIVINKIWQRLYDQQPDVQVLLQVHDSLAGQVPTNLVEVLRPAILECARVEIPYPTPLTIPFSLSFSNRSWGDCG